MGPKRKRRSSEIQNTSGDPEAMVGIKRKRGFSETQSLSGNPGAIPDAASARETVFDSILDALAKLSPFSNSIFAPTIFIVYAHDNEKEGEAYDKHVRTMISWLRRINAQILSDQFPVFDFDHTPDRKDAIRNIVANQLCILPPCTDTDGKRTVAEKVIVCGSDVLENYYHKPWVFPYMNRIIEIVNTKATQSPDSLKSELRDCVQSCTESVKDDFHHVITELAFLQVRKSHFEERRQPHGMVPISLKQGGDEAPMQYLPFFTNSDLKLTLKSNEEHSWHKLFFKLLEQLFPDTIDIIGPFKKCYNLIVEPLERESKVPTSQEQLQDIINQHITKAHIEYQGRSSVRIRDGKVQEYAGRLGENVTRVLEIIEQDTQREILNWLSPIKVHKLHGKYDDLGTARMEGTCDWVIQDNTFCQWRSCEGSALLFLRGNMGTGKTYTTSRVIDWARDDLSRTERNEALAFFYCYKQDQHRSEAKPIIQNIIRQLATGPWTASGTSNTIHKAVLDLWKKQELHGDSTFKQWAECLLALVDTYSRTTIILDALDECEASERAGLINLLVTLTTRDSNAKVRLFVSTRPDEIMFQNLAGKYPIIDMHEKDTRKDIATFVQARLARHDRWPKFDQAFKQELINSLLEKSRDMFLLASLHIDRVMRLQYKEDIRVILGKLPEELSKAYEEIYCHATNGGDTAKKFTDRALRWVLCSLRPLTTDELLFAISQDPENDSVTVSDQDVSEDSILTSCHKLLSLYSDSNSESHDESDNINGRSNGPPVWRLAHQAVAEFLETSDCYSAHAHYEVGSVCLNLLMDASFGASAWILSHPDHNSEHDGDVSDTSETFEYSEEVSGISKDISKDSLCLYTENRGPRTVRNFWNLRMAHRELHNPLAEYASYAWPTHVRAHEHSEARIDRRLSKEHLGRFCQTLQRFLGKPKEGSPAFKRWYEHIVGANRAHPQWSIFQSRSVLSFNPLLMETEMTPIIFACYMGFYTTLKEWWESPDLEYNACFRTRAWSRNNLCGLTRYKTEFSWSLVAVACANDEVEILRYLLSRGAAVNTEAEDQMPAIVTAAANHSKKAALELIQYGTNLCSTFTERHGTVLRFAMYHDSLDIMELLLKRCACEQLEIQRTIQHFPFYYIRSERAISLLIDFGVDVNLSLKGATLLATAVCRGWEDLVEQLLDKGAKVNTECKNGSFRYALDAAIAKPMHASIARRLVAEGARISGRSLPPLLRVARSDRDWGKALQYLRGHAVDDVWPEAGDSANYRTSALIEEVRAGNLDGVRDLIKFGANVNLRVEGYYGDALNAAFISTLDRGFSLTPPEEYPTITGRYPTDLLVEALDKAGANLQSLHGERLDTALAAAALAGLEQMVDDFLGRGASPGAICTHKFTTALGAAAASTHPGAPEILDKLLANGAIVNARFPDRSVRYGEECRYALDFPLQLMLEEGRQPNEPDHAKNTARNRRLDTWLKSASILVSNGAIWDIDFSAWEKCLERVDPGFSHRKAKRLDEIRQNLENSNGTSLFEPHQPGSNRRVSYIMWTVCNK